MEWYWSYRSLPELADLSREQRKQIWRKCREETRHGPLVLCAKLFPLAVSLALLVMAGVLHRFGFLLWAALAIPTLGDLITRPLIIAAARPRIRQVLGNRCVACGYLLTGNLSGRCPECGNVLKPRVIRRK